MRVLIAILAAVAGALTVGAAHSAAATQVIVSQTLDLSKADLASTFLNASFNAAHEIFSPIQAFDLAVGDTLTWNVDFKDDQALEIIGLYSPVAIFVTEGFSDPATVSMTGSLEFFGPGGSKVYAIALSDTNASLHVGQFFYGDFGSRPDLTFSSFRYTGLVNAYGAYFQSPVPVSRSYELPEFGVSGAAVRLVSAPQSGPGLVPEPGTWALMLLGFGAIGGALRRRHLQFLQ